MVGTLVRQLAKNATTGQIENSPLAQYFVDHGRGVYPADAAGNPWSAATIASGEDAIMNLVEDLAAEQKARSTYDNILRFSDDPDVNKVIKFLREREVVHFQRFGEKNCHLDTMLVLKNRMHRIRFSSILQTSIYNGSRFYFTISSTIALKYFAAVYK